MVAIGGRDTHDINGFSTFQQWARMFRHGTPGFRSGTPSPLIIDAADDSSHIEPVGGTPEEPVAAITLGSIIAACDREVGFLQLDIEGPR